MGLGPAEYTAGGGGDPRSSACCGAAGREAPVEGCAGFPRPLCGDPGPEAGPRGSSAGGNGRRPLSSWPTEKGSVGRAGAVSQPTGAQAGSWGDRGAAAGFVPGHPGSGWRGRGWERREVAGPLRGPHPLHASLLPWGVFGTPQPAEASGGVTWKGFLRLLRRRVHVGACPHGPSLRSWARGRDLTAGRPATDLEGSFTQVSAPSDTKHELKDSTTHRLLETYIYVSIVKCGN